MSDLDVTNPPIPNLSNALSTVSSETNDNDEDDWGFAYPTCDWQPLGQDRDCGEGVICPPCD